MRRFLVILLLLNSVLLAQENIYVDASVSSTTRNGSSWEHAYKTLTDAQYNLAENPRQVIILMAEGVYKPTFASTPFYVASAGVDVLQRIQGGYCSGTFTYNPTACPTIISGDMNGDDNYNNWPKTSIEADNAAQSGLQKDNATQMFRSDADLKFTSITFRGIRNTMVSSSKDVTFYNCKFENGIFLQLVSLLSEKRVLLVDRCFFTKQITNTWSMSGWGIILFEGNTETTVSNSVFYNNVGRQITGISSARLYTLKVYNNTFVDIDMQADGTSLGVISQSYNSLNVSNNIFYDIKPSNEPIIEAYNFSEFLLLNNRFPSTAPAITVATQSSGNTFVEPGFVNAASGDFRLKSNSPLIDAGNNTYKGLGYDVAGTPRTNDGNGDGTSVVDIGAYEFVLSCAGTGNWITVRNLLDTNGLFAVQEKNVTKCALVDTNNTKVPRIVELNPTNAKIFRLTKGISTLHWLKRMNLSSNLIDDLPISFSSMPNLKTIDLSNNFIDTIPKGFESIMGTAFDSLIVSNNRIRYIAPEVQLRLQQEKIVAEANNLCVGRSTLRNNWLTSAFRSNWSKGQAPGCNLSTPTLIVRESGKPTCVSGSRPVFNTIQEAVNQSGDNLILICDGDYNESVTIAGKYAWIMRATAADGALPEMQTSTGSVRIRNSGQAVFNIIGSHVHLEGLDIENTNTNQGSFAISSDESIVQVEKSVVKSAMGTAIGHPDVQVITLPFAYEVRDSKITGQTGIARQNSSIYAINDTINATDRLVAVNNSGSFHDYFKDLLFLGGGVGIDNSTSSMFKNIKITSAASLIENLGNGIIIDSLSFTTPTKKILGGIKNSYLNNLQIDGGVFTGPAIDSIGYSIVENIRISRTAISSSALKKSFFGTIKSSRFHNFVIANTSNYNSVIDTLNTDTLVGVSTVLISKPFAKVITGNSEIASSIIQSNTKIGETCINGSLISYNTLIENVNCGTKSNFTATVYNNSNSTVDPKLTSEEYGNFYPLVGSPAIDKGSTNASHLKFVTSKDLFGNPRIFNSTIDVGAYEYINARKYALTTIIDGIGGGSSSSTASIDPGVDFALIAPTKMTSAFDKWTPVNGELLFADATKPTTTVKIYSDATIQANYVALKKLTVNYGTGASSTSPTTLYGDLTHPVSIVAPSPQSGYKFWRWEAQTGSPTILNPSSSSTTVTLSADASVLARYAKIVILTLQTSGSGTISANPSSNIGADMDDVVITATPNPGLAFKDFSIAPAGAVTVISSSSKQITVKLNQGATITANFLPIIASYFESTCNPATNVDCHNPSQYGPYFKAVWVTRSKTGSTLENKLNFLIQLCNSGDWEGDQFLYLDFLTGGDANGFDRRIRLESLRNSILTTSLEDFNNSQWNFVSQSSVTVNVASSQTLPGGGTGAAGTLLEFSVDFPSLTTGNNVKWWLRGNQDEVGSQSNPIVTTILNDGRIIDINGQVSDWGQ